MNFKEITANQPAGFIAPTISETGESVVFGFRLKDGSTQFYAVGSEDLASIIRYMQVTADAAKRKRLATDPAAQDRENPESLNDVVVARIDLRSDPEGRRALMEATTTDGILVAAQLELEALETLRGSILDVMQVMADRRIQKANLQ